MAVAHHLHGVVVVYLVKQVKLLVGFHLEVERESGSQYYSHEDARRLKEHAGSFGTMQTPVFVTGNAH